MKSRKSVSEAMVTGGVLCFTMSVIHVFWRLIKAFTGAFNQHYSADYRGFLAAQVWAAFALMIGAGVIMLIVCAMFIPDKKPDSEVENDIAIIPLLICAGFMGSVVWDFESHLLCGASSLNIGLGIAVIICFFIALFEQ